MRAVRIQHVPGVGSGAGSSARSGSSAGRSGGKGAGDPVFPRGPGFFKRLRKSIDAMCLIDSLLAVGIIGIIAAVGIPNLVITYIDMSQTKLQRDVARLNQNVTCYLKDGGSLEGLSDPQTVLDKLKTARPSADEKTGSKVDAGQMALRQIDSQIQSNEARAVWDPCTQRFEISYMSGQAGIADFYIDETHANVMCPTAPVKKPAS